MWPRHLTFGCVLLIAAVFAANAVLAGNAYGHDEDRQAKPDKAAKSKKEFPACEHPWPCADGSEWPVGLEGPFDFGPVESVSVVNGNVRLEGWLRLPDLSQMPAGTRIPTLLSVSPYFGACNYRIPDIVTGINTIGPAGSCIPTPRSDSWWAEPPQRPHFTAFESWGIAPVTLLREGYAMAFFSQRGTGPSEGCYDFPGLNQNGDVVKMVEWLASQPWSNKRIGIGGVSGTAAPAIVGAVSGALPLKTVVLAGTVQDSYTYIHTPQGAGSLFHEALQPLGHQMMVSFMPPIADAHGEGPRERVAQRACPEAIETATMVKGSQFDDRNAKSWQRHSVLEDLDQVTASLLVSQGFKDRGGHAFQDTYLWPLVDSPKRLIMPQAVHGFPIVEHQSRDVLVGLGATWHTIVTDWLDFWLKGVGPVPEGVDRVDYEEQGGEWRESSAWPPVESRDEVLYLADTSLRAAPGSAPRTFRAVPLTGDDAASAEQHGLPWNTWASVCDTTGLGISPTSLAFRSPPMAESAVLAGNPFAYLRLSSDQPGGVVSVFLFEEPADFDCTAAGQPARLHLIGFGAADLRFHQGNFVARDFPKGATGVRVDIYDAADHIEAGNRLLVVLSQGAILPPFARVQQAYSPEITVHQDSHLVLPITRGTLGGMAPTLAYPPRPFLEAE